MFKFPLGLAVQGKGARDYLPSYSRGAQLNTSPKSADSGATSQVESLWGAILLPRGNVDCNLNSSAYASHALAKSSVEIDTSNRLRASQGAQSKRFFCARSFMVGAVRALRSAVFSEYGSVNLVAPATYGLTPKGGGSLNSEDPRHACTQAIASRGTTVLSRWFHDLRFYHHTNPRQTWSHFRAWRLGAEVYQGGLFV